MPKKMGMNSKAVEARERKQATKKANQEKQEKDAEDRLWQDDDKNLLKKQQRREEDERKKVEAAKRKAEAKVLLDKESAELTKQTGKQTLAKINQQNILEEMEIKQRAIEAINAKNHQTSGRIVQQPLIEENLNRSMADTDVASNIDEAISVLSMREEDQHPEKRMRAAYKTFEDTNLPRIKSENPNLRLSQWKQILMKEWNKSPDNPFNQ